MWPRVLGSKEQSQDLEADRLGAESQPWGGGPRKGPPGSEAPATAPEWVTESTGLRPCLSQVSHICDGHQVLRASESELSWKTLPQKCQRHCTLMALGPTSRSRSAQRSQIPHQQEQGFCLQHLFIFGMLDSGTWMHACMFNASTV